MGIPIVLVISATCSYREEYVNEGARSRMGAGVERVSIKQLQTLNPKPWPRQALYPQVNVGALKATLKLHPTPQPANHNRHGSSLPL